MRRRVLRVVEPDGPSTDGGRKARQSIVLVPEDGELGGTIVCGWLDVFRRAAELKTYAVVSQTFHDRYGMPIDLSRSEYHRMLDAMVDFLRGLHIDTRMAQPPRGRTFISERSAVPSSSMAQRRDPLERVTLVMGGTLFGFSLCYALFVLGVF